MQRTLQKSEAARRRWRKQGEAGPHISRAWARVSGSQYHTRASSVRLTSGCIKMFSRYCTTSPSSRHGSGVPRARRAPRVGGCLLGTAASFAAVGSSAAQLPPALAQKAVGCARECQRRVPVACSRACMGSDHWNAAQTSRALVDSRGCSPSRRSERGESHTNAEARSVRNDELDHAPGSRARRADGSQLALQRKPPHCRTCRTRARRVQRREAGRGSRYGTPHRTGRTG